MFTLASCGGVGERGEEDWTNGAQAYLSQHYTGDFQLLDSRVEEGVTVLTYQTQDELELLFEVRCWVDGLDTPWGEFPLIPQRKYTENFIQCLDRRLIGGAPVDVSGYSLDEMVELFQHTWEQLNEAYEQYGADWVTPNFEMEVCCNGITASIRYMGQDASILQDTLVRELLAGDQPAEGRGKMLNLGTQNEIWSMTIKMKHHRKFCVYDK